MMPTAARLFAALAYAVVAFAASERFKPLLPEGLDTGYLSEINAAIGLLSGWFVMGRLAGDGYLRAVTHGVRTTAVLAFYVLLAHSVREMFRLSMRMRYDGPLEAVVGVFEVAMDYGRMIVTAPEVMGILLLGGVLAAWVAEFAARRWN
ncbi:TrgA family protein [Actibacterium sp. MT2.3-13A]|uniref:TrgA family protein n=1 Tax=Actibacterium sp. MT2.3-13A TaxID=2828332 RepID=UPI001BA9E644|nr:TrgA family protein [Actibacterium sp. MT2.3-13A]